MCGCVESKCRRPEFRRIPMIGNRLKPALRSLFIHRKFVKTLVQVISHVVHFTGGPLVPRNVFPSMHLCYKTGPVGDYRFRAFEYSLAMTCMQSVSNICWPRCRAAQQVSKEV